MDGDRQMGGVVGGVNGLTTAYKKLNGDPHGVNVGRAPKCAPAVRQISKILRATGQRVGWARFICPTSVIN